MRGGEWYSFPKPGESISVCVGGGGNAEGGGKNGTAFPDQASPLVCVWGR